MLPQTTSKMRELFYEFKKHLTGVKTQKPRQVFPSIFASYQGIK